MKLPFSSVTIPIDASAQSEHGVDYAFDATTRDAKLHFCSVVDPNLTSFGTLTGAVVDPGPTVDLLEEAAEKLCTDAVAAARHLGRTADSSVLFGSPSYAIAKFADDSRSDAVLLCTHGRRGLNRLVNGSVAEDLLVNSRVPVVVTHAQDAAGAGAITAAIDGSPASTAALHAAIAMAQRARRPLAIVHVVGPAEAWDDAGPILAAGADVVRAAGIDFELVTLRGDAADTIVADARRRESPMIVMGTQGRGGLARLALGSVAAAVLQRAGVPVTVVRAA